MINKIKKLLLTIAPKDRWLSIKNKVISTLWQCFLASLSVFYVTGAPNYPSITKETLWAFLTAFIGAFLSAVKNIINEYKQTTITGENYDQLAENRGGIQNATG